MSSQGAVGQLDRLRALRDVAHRRMLRWLWVAIIGIVMAGVGAMYWYTPSMYVLWGTGMVLSLGSMYFGVRRNSKRYWALQHDYDVLLRAVTGLELLKRIVDDTDD